ncbi:MAG TPA: alpha/beta fold hydrolase, partial [Candidatus Dormibacteraeota bacterium]
MTARKHGYAPVNGLELYHEIHGSGDPLVLLHGGVVGMTMFDPILPELSRGRQVIAVDLQGHGRTADINRPLSFETMADD